MSPVHACRAMLIAPRAGAEAVQGRGDDGTESLASPSPSMSSRYVRGFGHDLCGVDCAPCSVCPGLMWRVDSRQAPKSRSAKKRERQKAKKKASQLHVSDAVSAQVEGAEVVASEVVVANSSGPESDGCQQVVVFDGYADDEDAAKAGEAGGGVGGSQPVSANLLATWKDMSDSFMKGVSEISAKAKQSVNQMDSGRPGDNYPQRQDQGQGEVRTRGSVGHPAEDSSCVAGEEQGGLPRPSSLAATLGSLLTHVRIGHTPSPPCAFRRPCAYVLPRVEFFPGLVRALFAVCFLSVSTFFAA